MDVSKVFIAKLNRINYLVWATQMQALLQAKDLWKHVGDEVVSIPTSTETGISVNNGSQGECMARAMVMCSIEAEYIPMISAEKNQERYGKC